MASSLTWKVFRHGEDAGCCHYAADATSLVVVFSEEKELLTADYRDDWLATMMFERAGLKVPQENRIRKARHQKDA